MIVYNLLFIMTLISIAFILVDGASEAIPKRIQWIDQPDITVEHKDRVCYGWTEYYNHDDHTKLRCRKH